MDTDQIPNTHINIYYYINTHENVLNMADFQNSVKESECPRYVGILGQWVSSLSALCLQ